MRAMQAVPPPQAIREIERPSPKLLHYYVLKCLLTGPAFPFVLIPHYFKYHTLRYRFDAEGISLRWGILFRREIVLNYARIQDIHLSSNLVERWLGLAKIEIQTAAGNAKSEMSIEGIREFEAVRDFLYARMRGTQDSFKTPSHSAGSALAMGEHGELVKTLQAVAEELRSIRLALEKKRPGEN
jgi:putative membrane protein